MVTKALELMDKLAVNANFSDGALGRLASELVQPNSIDDSAHPCLKPEMTEEHFLAMKTYAAAHGRKWKERLTQAWLGDWREQWGVLRAIRNDPYYHAGMGLVGIFKTYERQRKSRAELMANANSQSSQAL